MSKGVLISGKRSDGYETAILAVKSMLGSEFKPAGNDERERGVR